MRTIKPRSLRGSVRRDTGLLNPLPVVVRQSKRRADAHQVQGFFVRKNPSTCFTRARVRVQVWFCRFENLEFTQEYAKNLFSSVITAP
jgi:hypothetical protein